MHQFREYRQQIIAESPRRRKPNTTVEVADTKENAQKTYKHYKEHIAMIGRSIPKHKKEAHAHLHHADKHMNLAFSNGGRSPINGPEKYMDHFLKATEHIYQAQRHLKTKE